MTWKRILIDLSINIDSSVQECLHTLAITNFQGKQEPNRAIRGANGYIPIKQHFHDFGITALGSRTLGYFSILIMCIYVGAVVEQCSS